MKDEPNLDRTLTLIDSFLSSLPEEPLPVKVEYDLSTDYTTYFLQEDSDIAPDESADKKFKTKTDPATGLDIQVKKAYQSNWSFSIYNVYNRMNPFFLYVDNDGDFMSGDFSLKIKQVSLFPIIPSATWNFEF